MTTSINSKAIDNFRQAFYNLKPTVTTEGSNIKIKERDKSYLIPISRSFPVSTIHTR